MAIRSDAPLQITPTVTDLTGAGTIPASAVEFFRVGYVKLQRVSTGVRLPRGRRRYPDPLFPVWGAIAVPANETTSVYALVHVPGDAAAGRYDGTLDLGAAGSVPSPSRSPRSRRTATATRWWPASTRSSSPRPRA